MSVLSTCRTCYDAGLSAACAVAISGNCFTLPVLFPCSWLAFGLVVTRRNCYSTPGPVSTGIGYRVRGSASGARNLSQFITTHPGQLSLTILPGAH